MLQDIHMFVAPSALFPPFASTSLPGGGWYHPPMWRLLIFCAGWGYCYTFHIYEWCHSATYPKDIQHHPHPIVDVPRLRMLQGSFGSVKSLRSVNPAIDFTWALWPCLWVPHSPLGLWTWYHTHFNLTFGSGTMYSGWITGPDLIPTSGAITFFCQDCEWYYLETMEMALDCNWDGQFCTQVIVLYVSFSYRVRELTGSLYVAVQYLGEGALCWHGGLMTENAGIRTYLTTSIVVGYLCGKFCYRKIISLGLGTVIPRIHCQCVVIITKLCTLRIHYVRIYDKIYRHYSCSVKIVLICS